MPHSQVAAAPAPPTSASLSPMAGMLAGSTQPDDLAAAERVAAFAADSREDTLSLAGLGLRALPAALLALPAGAAARLTRLDLARNVLDTLPSSFADSLPALRVLFLLSNRFRAVPPVLRRCGAMRMLSFKDNALDSVDAKFLPPALTWLILTSNRLEALPVDFGARTRRVVKLMLSNNQLTSAGLPANFVPPACELLRLNNNRLDAVPEAVFVAPALAWLGLGGNPCTGASQSLAELDQTARVRLEDYELENSPSLGCGASGEVWRAVERASGDEVAVKVYKTRETSDGSVVDEMRAALALRGTGLIPVRGFFGADTGRFGLVMDLVCGMREVGAPPSFDSISRDVYPDSRFEKLADAAMIVREAARVAAAVHARRYAHGDLYGHNLLEDCATGRCFLTDLGASYPYEDARIEKIEVRAFGILVAELVAATPRGVKEEVARAGLLQIANQCMSRALEDRPAFAELAALLEDTTSW
jgi:Protein kinase domain